MFPSTVNVTELGDQELSDDLFLCYIIYPPEPPAHSDDYNSAFSICQALDCKKGGFIMTHYNEIQYGVAELSGKYFTPSHVCDDTLKHPGRAVQEGKYQPTRSPQNKPTAAKVT